MIIDGGDNFHPQNTPIIEDIDDIEKPQKPNDNKNLAIYSGPGEKPQKPNDNKNLAIYSGPGENLL